MGTRSPKRKEQFSGVCSGHLKALAIFAAAVAAALLRRTLQKGSFSMLGKRKLHSENLRAQAMRPIGREGGAGIAQCWRSLISTIALLTLHSDCKKYPTVNNFDNIIVAIVIWTWTYSHKGAVVGPVGACK